MSFWIASRPLRPSVQEQRIEQKVAKDAKITVADPAAEQEAGFPFNPKLFRWWSGSIGGKVTMVNKSKAMSLLLLSIACCAVGLAADEAKSKTASLGRVVEFSLPDVHGKTYTSKSWQSAPAVVLLFLGIECPLANGYAPEMTRLEREFTDRKVVFVGVHCDPDVTADIAAQHAKEYQLRFPILLDQEQKLATVTGVRKMSVAVVLRRNGEVAYRGRIDDRYNEQGKRRIEPTTHDLKQAIEAVLSGKQPDPAETKSYGCPLPKLISPLPSEKSSNK